MTKRTDLCAKCGDTLGKGENGLCSDCNEHELYTIIYMAGAAEYKAKYENALKEIERLKAGADA